MIAWFAMRVCHYYHGDTWTQIGHDPEQGRGFYLCWTCKKFRTK